MTELPPFPTDEDMLERIEYAMQAAWTFGEDGTGCLVGAEYNLTQLLDFMSGFDPNGAKRISGLANVMGVDVEAVYDCTETPTYTRDSLIAALIAEVRRLREGHARVEALIDKWHQEASAARRHGNLNARMSKRFAARSARRAIEGEAPQ